MVGLLIGRVVKATPPPSLRMVALTGRSAPGAAPLTFNVFNPPEIGPSGQVAFHAFLQGSGVTTSNDEGIWSEGTNGLGLAAREAVSPPAPNGLSVIRALDAPFSLSNGEVAISAYLTGSPTEVPLITTPSGLQQIAGPGFPVPDANGIPLANYSWVGLGVTGAYSSNALLLDGEVKQTSGKTFGGYWSKTNGITRLVAKENDQPPGALAGATFSYIGPPVMNSTGQLAFEGAVSDGGFGAGNYTSAIWVNRNGNLQLLAYPGSSASEVGPGVIYPNFVTRRPAINDQGQILYQAALDGPGITATNNQALIIDDAGSRRVVVQRGQPAPGTLPNMVYDRLDLGDAVINDNGDVAFSGWVTGPGVSSGNGQYGIWLKDSAGQLHAIARGGDSAPGGGAFQIDRQQPFALNDLGQVAFAAQLMTNQGWGIWGTDTSGVLQLIMRIGNQIEVGPGDVRTVSSVDFLHRDFSNESTGLHDGLQSGLNDRGDVAFVAQFQDGSSGIFVSSILAVPEPSTIVIALLATCLVICRRSK